MSAINKVSCNIKISKLTDVRPFDYSLAYKFGIWLALSLVCWLIYHIVIFPIVSDSAWIFRTFLVCVGVICLCAPTDDNISDIKDAVITIREKTDVNKLIDMVVNKKISYSEAEDRFFLGIKISREFILEKITKLPENYISLSFIQAILNQKFTAPIGLLFVKKKLTKEATYIAMSEEYLYDLARIIIDLGLDIDIVYSNEGLASWAVSSSHYRHLIMVIKDSSKKYSDSNLIKLTVQDHPSIKNIKDKRLSFSFYRIFSGEEIMKFLEEIGYSE